MKKKRRRRTTLHDNFRDHFLPNPRTNEDESRAYYIVEGARVAICLGLGLIFICLLVRLQWHAPRLEMVVSSRNSEYSLSCNRHRFALIAIITVRPRNEQSECRRRISTLLFSVGNGITLINRKDLFDLWENNGINAPDLWIANSPLLLFAELSSNSRLIMMKMMKIRGTWPKLEAMLIPIHLIVSVYLTSKWIHRWVHMNVVSKTHLFLGCGRSLVEIRSGTSHSLNRKSISEQHLLSSLVHTRTELLPVRGVQLTIFQWRSEFRRIRWKMGRTMKKPTFSRDEFTHEWSYGLLKSPEKNIWIGGSLYSWTVFLWKSL